MSELHEQIVEIFLSSREQRDAPWDEKNFMEFLILPNGKKLRKSFKGCRYSLRFINRIEEECCICLPQSFYDKEWNFSDFVAYVEKRKKRPGVDLRMAIDNFESDKWHYGLMLVIFFFPITALLLVGTVYAFLKLGVGIALVVLALLVGISWVHTTILGQMLHLKRLIPKLKAETTNRATAKNKASTLSSAESREAPS